MADISAIHANIDTNLKKNAEAILSQLGITPTFLIQMMYSQIVKNQGLPLTLNLPYPTPIAIGAMTREQLDNELQKGIDSLKNGGITADELDRKFAQEFGIL